jgi:hypothetical protein
MKLDNIENKKSVSIYNFDEFKKMKFDKFQIYFGSERPPNYSLKGEEYYPTLVKKEDYEKYGLIVKKEINVKKILKYSDWENIEELIENKENTEEFYHELYKNVRLFIEDDLYLKDGYFTLGDFQFTYIIDGVEIKLKESSSKRRNRIFLKSLNYLFWIYIVSVISFLFVDLTIGLIVLFFPGLIYFVWVLYKGFMELRDEIKYDRDGKNIFLYYLIKLPYKIVLYSFYIVLIFGWFLIPGYFIFESSFHYSLLELLGGEIGKVFWGTLYFFIMSYIGGKLMNYLDRIEKKIKSYF